MSVIVTKGVERCCDAAVGCGPVVPVVSRTILIQPGDTEIVDEVPYSDYLAVKWLVDITAITQSDQRSLAYEMYAVHSYGTSPSYIQYSMVGNPLAQDPTISIVGANLRYEITNNSVSDVFLVTLTRIPIIASSVVTMILAGLLNPTSVPFSYFTYTIPSSTTTTIDSISFNEFTACKWFVKLVNTTTGAVRSVEIYGNRRRNSGGNQARYNLYSSLGTLKKHKFDALMSGNDYELTVENTNATDSIDVYVTRVPIVLNPLYLCCVCDCGSIDVLPINDVVIPASSTLTVDTAAIASYVSVKWLMIMRNATTSEARVYEVYATHDGTTASYDVYGMTGDVIDASISVTLAAGLLRLDVTNDEVDDLSVDMAKISVPV
ncbi:MAG: hypothetical protein E4H14_01185 [Candidatus Thorarchaeota archaeon]|nr:MAG: hypothetical protein E4H14_01185 [Candidatus Thorarchaeota archaeon]